MFFKNLQVYRLPKNWDMTADRLAEALTSQAFSPASSNELLRQGWDPIHGQTVYPVNRQLLLKLVTEKKVLRRRSSTRSRRRAPTSSKNSRVSDPVRRR